MAAHLIKVEFVKTYATEANAIKAAEEKFGKHEAHLRYIVVPVIKEFNGKQMIRYGVAFLGEVALQNMVHFSGFNVLG